MKSVRINVQRRDTDTGFQAYMMGIYRYVALGTALTGGVAMTLAALAPHMGGLVSALFFVGMIATFGIVIYLGTALKNISVQRAHTLFWAFAVAEGATLTGIFSFYSMRSIALVFFVTAAIFTGLSLYAKSTKRDLTSLGSLCSVGLIGVVVMSIVNIFIGSSAISFTLSALGCLIFPGLIAYETQSLKDIYYSVPSGEMREKIAIMGALNLYISAINLFLSLLRLLGDRK